MTNLSFNCIICAQEFDTKDLISAASPEINRTHFKICQSCLEKVDPADDYKQARAIVSSYLNLNQAKTLFGEAKEILKSFK